LIRSGWTSQSPDTAQGTEKDEKIIDHDFYHYLVQPVNAFEFLIQSPRQTRNCRYAGALPFSALSQKWVGLLFSGKDYEDLLLRRARSHRPRGLMVEPPAHRLRLVVKVYRLFVMPRLARRLFATGFLVRPSASRR